MLIFCDLDEVLADFTGAACAVHGWTKERLLESASRSTPRVRDMVSLMGMNLSEFWGPINEKGEAFWTELEYLPWAFDLIELLRPHQWFVLTSPALFVESHLGKVRWIHERLSSAGMSSLRRSFITPHKELLAASDRILIDDHEENINKFVTAGGQGILFPCWGNWLHEQANDPLPYVKEQLEKLV